MRYLTKKKIAIIHAIVLFSIISTNVNAQQVVLTFTGRDSVNHYVQLNRVAITNLTKSWQETIIWPDTVLIMQNGTGIEDYIENGGFSLSQNNPNPFSRTTDVSLTTCEERLTQIEISDVNGHVVEKFDFSPQPGIHQFRVTLSAAGTYIMTARQNGQTSSIKMVCYGGGGTNVIDYLGMVQTITFVLKSTTTNPFNFGDMMEYVGYATINGNEVESQRISQAQGASQTFVLQFDVSQNQLPALTTHAVNNITTSSATVGGTVTADGGATVFDRGVCYSTTQMPTVSDNCVHIGQGTGPFSDNLTGLTANTTYYVRAYAMNSVGTAYGNEVLFTTTMAVQLPTVITTTVSNITETTAFSGGNVTFDGGATVTARGVCWSTSHNPTVNDSHTTDGNGTGVFTSNITGLAAGTTYYVRAYAINSAGTAYGDEMSFTTAQVPFACGTSTLSDIDGNMYNTVQIGNQCWMKENLRTTHYSDNTAISHGVSLSSDVPYYYYPDSNYYNVSTYGLLYNWKAVMHSSSSSTINPSGVQGICPNGWHVPSEAEWVQLTDYVSSQSQYVCGSNSSNIAKALANNTGWESSTTTCAVGNTQSNNNATGFSAMPAGGYFANGTQGSFGVRAYFWSTTENTNTRSYRLRISSMYSNISHGDNEKTGGLSVRCLKNNDGSTIQLPTVTTTVVSNITGTTAIGGGNIISDGGATVMTRGVCWSTSHNPTVNDSHTTDGNGMGGFTSNITGLTASTTYYVRAYAINSAGTAYGDEVSFTTETSTVGNDGQPCSGTPTFTDFDGNVYNTVQIGDQCWMKENLRTTHYANGASIPIGDQYSSSDPYYYNYSSSPIPLEQRGYLYNWFAVMHGANSSDANPSGVQGVCPTGWHVPSSAEWSQLTDYVQSQSQYLCISSWNDTYITKALASQTGWNSSPYENCDAGYNPSTNNATGFSAVPAGGWGSDGFDGIGISANFWSSTEHYAGEYWWTAYGRGLYYIDDPAFTNANLFYTFGKGGGISVRCLRNDGGSSSQSLPSVSTCAVSDILANTATSGVNVISDGGTTVTECGVCWSTNHNPTTSQNHTTDGCGIGSFTSIITGLTANTTYYVRAYATNSVGTAYGNEVSFTTTIQGAIIILEAHYVWGDGSGYQLLLDADATAYGTIIPTTGPLTSSGNADAATYAAFEYKIPQNADGSTYTTNVVLDGSDTIVIPAGVYDFCITNPTPGDRIWIAGSEYGRQDNFTFQINQTYHFYVDMGFGGDVVTMQPSVTTNAVSNVTSTTATFGGTVTSEGGSEVGIRGVCWSTSHNPTLSNSHTTINDCGIGSFSSNITGLTAGTTYYVRAYATNSVGTAYGNEVSFTTINNTTQLPTVTTSSVSNVTETSATCGGNVTSNGGSNVTARGVCWSTSHNPTTSNSHTINGSDTGSFTSNITGLTAGTTYYVRAYATNSVGTAYGNEVSFTINSSIVQDGQPCPGAATVTDVDNNTYNTVQIGSQCWMKENLRTTRYADGTFISQGNSMSATVPYWYYPNGANSNMLTYGLLYNWKAVMRDATSSSANPSGVQGICPTGWHVPSNAEMAQLTNYVSSQSQYVCGSDSTQIAKALASTTCWNSNTNTCAVGNVQTDNNASGFSLTPAGCYWGVFGYLGSQSLLWTTTENSEDSENRADFWKASYNKAIINHSNDTKPHGYSVRCLRDDNGSSTAQLPTVTTSSVSNVTATSATGGGNITSDGGANVTARGVCWSTSHNPTTSNSHTINGSGTGNFTSNITGLTAGTTYYVRAYATNNVGTAYGNEVSFTTQTSPTQFTCGTSTLTDIDGNVYNTVEIGNQCWMKENLRTTKYADGTLVSQGNSSSSTTAYWYYPNGDASNMSTHGLLYNGTAIKGTSSNGAQGICPTGWHVPSDAEWTQLSDYMSSQIEYVCGSDNNHIAKALASTIGWDSNYIPCSIGNTPANNNVTGFNALSAGSRSSNFDYYSGYGTYAAFGSSSSYFQTEIGDQIVIYYLKTDSSNIYKRKEPYYYAHSVRCVSNRVVVNTNTTGSVTASTLTCGGYVSDDGGENVTARGVCWSLSHNPIISGNHTTDGSGTGYFISSLSGLTAGTTYYVRAYAINSMGTVYGDEHAFTTTAVTSKMVSDITETSATCGGVVTNGASVISRGICWGTSHNPSLNDNHSADGSGTGIFNSTLTGLTPGMTYYVRAYAASNVDTLYGNEICFTTLQYCENITVNDVDGCEYHTVQIGDQCWMKENMRTTRYADGTAVELGSESEYSWSIAYRYHPNNDENNVATYGYLYNWRAAMHDSHTSSSNPSGVQGICPDGWHVPSDAEWTQLSNYVGSNSQYVCGSDSTYFAKALASTTGWNSSNNTCAVGNYSNNNNATRFSAFPAGDRNTFTYTNFGKKSIFWTTNTYNHTDGAYNNSISYDHASMSHNMEYSWNGYSVRCLRHNKIAPTLPTVTTSIVGNVSPISARGMGNVTNDGGADIISRGVCWSTSCNPTTDDSHTSENGGTGSFTSSITGLTPNTTYYVRAYAINSAGTAYGNVRYFTTTTITAWDGNACPQHSQLEDIDGHTYNTVQIGEQCWMKENLRTTKYADGTAIPYGSDYSETDAYWYYPNGNNSITYGLLYNRKAATRDAFTSYVQGVCPYGWHVPSEAERAQLYNYVNNYYACVSKALSSTLGWNYSTTSCHPGNSSSFNDASGFSALPAGDNSPNSAGNRARFWTVSGTWMIPTSSSSTPGSEKASVRCLRDADTTPIVITHELHDISATTAVGVGNIAYNGGAPVVECGFCWSTSHNPTLANSHKVGNMSDSDFTCLLQELVLNTTYYVRAYATNSIGTAYGNEVSFTTIAHYDAKPCPNITTVTDADGNVYNTIQIGSQCWMKENLKAKHYTDGTFISPRYSPDDNSANIATYGYLYGWDAVMHNTASSNANPSSVQGVCPNGWHLPSEAEWTQLSNYLVGHNHYWCNEISSNVAKSLAGNSLWSTVNNNFDCCSPGCNQSTNNITGFSALPAGYRGQISFDGLGNSAKFWSSTEGYANFVAYRYGIDYNTATVNLNSGNKADGCSVRCLHDGGGVITTNIPIINTSVVSDIYGRTATCGGDVSDDDGTSITARGVCWSTSQNPTTIDGHTTDGVGSGSFTSNITGLTPNTTYYVRAYATNNVWTVYGNEVSFTTPLAQGPSVITAEASNISPNTANCGGDVTYDGGANVIARGICWSISHNPTLNDNHTADGNGSGSFTNNLTGLSPNTTYYVRAYATNRVKTEYGGEVSFTTPAIQLPTVSTATVSSTIGTTAICGGNVISDGGATVTNRGICWSTEHNPTIANNHTSDGNGTGYFTSNLTGLTYSTTYYVRAYATNITGTSYGEEVFFTTSSLPTVITSPISNVLSTSATCGGNVISDGGETVTDRGVCWGISNNPTLADSHTVDGSGTGDFASVLTELTGGTTYFVRAYATNTVGTAYGIMETFTTAPGVPIVTTESISNITATSASCDGNVTFDGGSTVIARGFCWNTSNNPVIADSHTADGLGTGEFSSNITGLIPATTYYVRAYATNSIGSSYGTEITFATAGSPPCPNMPTILDADSNIYNTAFIGGVCWMRENLKTTKYADGTSLSQGTTTSTNIGYWYYPDNNSSNKETYGLLYNWKAVMRDSPSSEASPSGVQGICPNGWHVPSRLEWEQLINCFNSQSMYFCGGTSSNIAKALASTTGWQGSTGTCCVGNNQSSNNTTGFGMLPAGNYGAPSGNSSFGFASDYYSCTTLSDGRAIGPYLSNNLSDVRFGGSNKTIAQSVRCVRDY